MELSITAALWGRGLGTYCAVHNYSSPRGEQTQRVIWEECGFLLWWSLSQQQGGACWQIRQRAVPFSPPSITPAVSGKEAHGLGREEGNDKPSQHQPHQPRTNPTGHQVTARSPSHPRPYSKQPYFSKCGERVAGPTVILTLPSAQHHQLSQATHVFSSNPPFKSSPAFEKKLASLKPTQSSFL